MIMAVEKPFYCSNETFEKSTEDIPCKIVVLGNKLSQIKSIFYKYYL
jgi:hypothetical protein